MVMTIGRPITVGVMKEANKFSFILILKGFFVFDVCVCPFSECGRDNELQAAVEECRLPSSLCRSPTASKTTG